MNDTVIGHLNDILPIDLLERELDVRRISFYVFTDTDKRRLHDLYIT